jgi:hypothetical protein
MKKVIQVTTQKNWDAATFGHKCSKEANRHTVYVPTDAELSSDKDVYYYFYCEKTPIVIYCCSPDELFLIN